MTLREQFDIDLQSIADDMGNPVLEWKGEEYECIPSSKGASLVLETGGFAGPSDIVFNVRKDLFSDDILPESQQKVTYNDITYRIDSVRTDSQAAFIRLICVEVARGI